MSPRSARISIVFPEPFAPARPTVLPGGISSVMLSRTLVPRMHFDSFVAVMAHPFPRELSGCMEGRMQDAPRLSVPFIPHTPYQDSPCERSGFLPARCSLR